jgi:hypothetical protein
VNDDIHAFQKRPDDDIAANRVGSEPDTGRHETGSRPAGQQSETALESDFSRASHVPSISLTNPGTSGRVSAFPCLKFEPTREEGCQDKPTWQGVSRPRRRTLVSCRTK